MNKKVKIIPETDKIELKDWKKLTIKKSEMKGKRSDTQKILRQMRYGKPIYC